MFSQINLNIANSIKVHDPIELALLALLALIGIDWLFTLTSHALLGMNCGLSDIV
jgi:hypothetical protein